MKIGQGSRGMGSQRKITDASIKILDNTIMRSRDKRSEVAMIRWGTEGS